MAEGSFQFSEEVNTSPSPDGERQSIFLFNCDGIYNLDVLETFLNQVKSKLDFEFSITKIYFPLSQMSELCSNKIPKFKMDMAFFVVHANESRLSINEDNAGIGYAKVYRALLQATEGRVIVVIGGDDNYKNESEEDSAVISRWARRKISSQFSEETLDGRESFVFSWDKNHRPIHEAALLHYFDPGKLKNKFEYHRPAGLSESPARKMEEKRQEIVGLQTTSGAAEPSSRSLTNKGHPEMEKSENEETESEPGSLRTHEEANVAISRDLAILCRDTSDMDDVRNLFGVLGMRPDVLVGCLSEFKRYLENNSLKVCIIMMNESMPGTRSEEWSDVLRTARRRVINKVIVIVCSDKRNTGAPIVQDAELRITEAVQGALGDKGLTLWWKGGTGHPNDDPVMEINSTVSLEDALAESSHEPDVSQTLGEGLSEEGTSNEMPYETLLLETLLINGNISYDEKDVKVRKENWSPPRAIVRSLLEKWKRTTLWELRIYLINNEANKPQYRVIVNEIHAQSSYSWKEIFGFMDG